MLGGFQIGRSALLTSQRAMQVTGQNLANAATIGYRRRTVELTSLGATNGVFSGQGVGISSIRRELDPALAARLRGALSMEVANGTEYTYLSQVESLQDGVSSGRSAIWPTTRPMTLCVVWRSLVVRPWLIVSTACMPITSTRAPTWTLTFRRARDKLINC